MRNRAWIGSIDYEAPAKAISALAAQTSISIVSVRSDGTTALSEMQVAPTKGRTTNLVYFVFDLPFLDGENATKPPLLERNGRLKALLQGAPRSVQYSDHHIRRWRPIFAGCCVGDLWVAIFEARREDKLAQFYGTALNLLSLVRRAIEKFVSSPPSRLSKFTSTEASRPQKPSRNRPELERHP